VVCRALARFFLQAFPRCADKPDMNVMSAALSGMQQAQSNLDKTAQRIAHAGINQAGANQAPGDTVDLSTEMVNLMAARQQFSTSARVAHVGDEMQKSLLNMMA
jgi:flagellar hook-associated protein FlgK